MTSSEGLFQLEKEVDHGLSDVALTTIEDSTYNDIFRAVYYKVWGINSYEIRSDIEASVREEWRFHD